MSDAFQAAYREVALVNRRLRSERDQLRAEIRRLRRWGPPAIRAIDNRDAEIKRLRAALAGCINSLEYVDRGGIGNGGSTGYGVRADRIAKAKAALAGKEE